MSCSRTPSPQKSKNKQSIAFQIVLERLRRACLTSFPLFLAWRGDIGLYTTTPLKQPHRRSVILGVDTWYSLSSTPGSLVSSFSRTSNFKEGYLFSIFCDSYYLERVHFSPQPPRCRSPWSQYTEAVYIAEINIFFLDGSWFIKLKWVILAIKLWYADSIGTACRIAKLYWYAGAVPASQHPWFLPDFTGIR